MTVVIDRPARVELRFTHHPRLSVALRDAGRVVPAEKGDRAARRDQSALSTSFTRLRYVVATSSQEWAALAFRTTLLRTFLLCKQGPFSCCGEIRVFWTC